MENRKFKYRNIDMPIPAAAQSKAGVCGRLPAWIVGSNPAEDLDVRLWCRHQTLRRADHSFRGVLQGLCVCVCVSDLETSTVRRSRSELGCWAHREESRLNPCNIVTY